MADGTTVVPYESVLLTKAQEAIIDLTAMVEAIP
jgi:hypothetical protein